MAHKKCLDAANRYCHCIKDDVDELANLKKKKILKAWTIVTRRGNLSKNGGMFEIFDNQILAETHMAMSVGYNECKVVPIELL